MLTKLMLWTTPMFVWLWMLEWQTDRHNVTVVECGRRHRVLPGHDDEPPEVNWVARCSVCGDLNECTSNRPMVNTEGADHREYLTKDFANAVDAITGQRT